MAIVELLDAYTPQGARIGHNLLTVGQDPIPAADSDLPAGEVSSDVPAAESPGLVVADVPEEEIPAEKDLTVDDVPATPEVDPEQGEPVVATDDGAIVVHDKNANGGYRYVEEGPGALDPPVEHSEVVPPVSATTFCIIALVVQFFSVYTALAVVRQVNAFCDNKWAGAQRTLEETTTSVNLVREEFSIFTIMFDIR